MKNILIIIALFVSFGLNAQTKQPEQKQPDKVSQVKIIDAINNKDLAQLINDFLKQPGIKLELISYAIIKNEGMPGGESRSVIIAYHTESK